jgi:transposase InsO family protein
MAQKDQNEKIALFKYGIIAPVIHDTAKRQTDYFKDIAQKIFDVPDIGRKTYSWRTFKTWLRDYRIHGFDGLKPKERTDKGASRKMDTALALVIKEKFETFPQINISALYRMLAAEGYINGGSPCQETLRRFINNHDLKPEIEPLTPRKKFEKPHVNELGLSDVMQGMPLLIYNKKRRPFLCGIIDDHSRLMVGFKWAFSENTQTLELVLKEAILTYALPKVLYCDNGAVFSSTHLQSVCARLNIALVHSKPYDSPARGKIERFWRTVRQGFLAILPQNENRSLEQFNQSFAHWIDAHYHRVIHHTTAQTPLDRYLDDLKMTQLKRVEQHQLDLIFYQTVIRKVKNDATISLNGQLFEVPQQYIGNKIELRHPTGQPLNLWIYEQDKPVCKIKKLDPVFNSQNTVSAIRFSKKEDTDV